MPRKRIVGTRAWWRTFWVLLVMLLVWLPGLARAVPELLAPYEDGSRQFEEVEIGDDLLVYYHQRMLGDAIVEKDYLVYQEMQA